MKQKETQKPLMVAYILFLVICCVYYMISGVFHLNFPIWERIVVAATIASYFFSLASMDKFTIKLAQRELDRIDKENALYLRIIKKLNETPETSHRSNKSPDYFSARLTKNHADATNAENEINKITKKAFRNDVAGFLVFFCIVSFDALFQLFFNIQEVITLLAFIAILVIEYLESTKLSEYETTCQAIIDNLETILYDHIDNS